MSSPVRLRPPLILLLFFFLVIPSVHGSSIKCGSCPTVYYPPPPPPSLPPPVKPRPPTGYCPPPPYYPRSPPYYPHSPPSPDIIYITGPPGSLYPIDLNNSVSGRRSYLVALAAFGAGLAALIMMW